MQERLGAPWSLHFDRDGTEDFGIICDAEGNDLVASHLPCTRIAERTFGPGTFWLPESTDDKTPRRVRQMQLMTAAPKLLAALRDILPYAETEARWLNLREYDKKGKAKAKRAWEAVENAWAIITEATSKEA